MLYHLTYGFPVFFLSFFNDNLSSLFWTYLFTLFICMTTNFYIYSPNVISQGSPLVQEGLEKVVVYIQDVNPTPTGWFFGQNLLASSLVQYYEIH